MLDHIKKTSAWRHGASSNDGGVLFRRREIQVIRTAASSVRDPLVTQLCRLRCIWVELHSPWLRVKRGSRWKDDLVESRICVCRHVVKRFCRIRRHVVDAGFRVESTNYGCCTWRLQVVQSLAMSAYLPLTIRRLRVTGGLFEKTRNLNHVYTP